jgi:hypothetical protein
MGKPTVFISHITEEKELAIAFRDFIQTTFLGLFDIFVSSDGESIKMGDRWLTSITEALKHCAVEIIFCSPHSVQRPWINFEAGAGWVRGIPVIPICHSGMTRTALPIPLNMLQATDANDAVGLVGALAVLASAIGAQLPRVDVTPLIAQVRLLEEDYTFWRRLDKAMGLLDQIDPRLLSALKTGRQITTSIKFGKYDDLVEEFGWLRSQLVLDIAPNSRTTIADDGEMFRPVLIKQLERWPSIVTDPRFRR